MGFHHLERRGWSKQELDHARSAMDRAEAGKHRHVRIIEDLHTGLLVAILSLAAAGVTLLLSPLIMLGMPLVSVPAMLLLGVCMGLLYVHSSSHHELGLVTLCIISFILIMVTAGLFTKQPMHLALSYSAGMVGAYFERRYHGA